MDKTGSKEQILYQEEVPLGPWGPTSRILGLA